MQIQPTDEVASPKIVPFRMPVGSQPTWSWPPLPAQVSALIGRERDMAALIELIRHPDTRLVTINGPGGIGKTRLALEAVARLTPHYSGGAGFIQLAHLQDPALIGPAVAAQLKLQRAGLGSLLDQIVGAIGREPALAVFDNFEHILSSAGFVINLLTACPTLTVVVTSRARLNVRGEREFRVGPLDIAYAETAPPDDLPPAVALFVARASEANPRFTVTAQRLEQIADICGDLDGLPLAIELAAARSRVIPPEAMRPLIKRRLEFLTGGPRDAPKRQQTVRDTIRWTYDLLPEREQRLFRLLSVFPAGFTLDAAMALANAAGYVRHGDDPMLALIEGTEVLSDNSLLRTIPVGDPALGETRFSFYEMIREFGSEQLAAHGEVDLAHEGSRQWCRGLAGYAETADRGVGYAAFDLLEQEYPNIRACLVWLRDHGEARAGLEILQPLAWFMTQRYLLEEATGWADTFLVMPDARVDRERYAHALNGAAKVHFWYSDYQRAIELNESALAIWRKIGAPEIVAQTLQDLANVIFDAGDIAHTKALLHESLMLFEQIGNRLGRAVTSALLARVALEERDAEGALAMYQPVVAEFEALGQQTWIAFGRESIGLTYLELDELAKAKSEIGRAIEMAYELSDYWRLACCLTHFGEIARRTGDEVRAVALLAAGEAHRAAMGIALRPSTSRRVTGWTDRARAMFEPARFAQIWEAGRALTRDDAYAVAIGRADVALPAAAAIGTQSAATSNAAGLTPREFEVLTLICQGFANREIGTQLFISHRTVMQHVANIFTKIDVNSRTAAAAWAHRNGLV